LCRISAMVWRRAKRGGGEGGWVVAGCGGRCGASEGRTLAWLLESVQPLSVVVLPLE